MHLTGRVRVSVPATSANLGPGFDCLGLALELRDELTAVASGDGLVVEVAGESADDVPRDATHLVVRALTAALEAMGEVVPPLRLSCVNRIPHSRGLGSSSAAIVGGIALARGLVVDGSTLLDDAAALALANRLEGHPDNVAPALLGGFVVCGQADGEVWAAPAPVDPSIRAMVFIPPDGLSTELARSLLPESMPYPDAVANTGRAALLVTALGQTPDQLWRATEDFVHQSYRRPAMPVSLALVDRLRAEGHAAVVSGAGPTVLVLTGDAELASLSRFVPAGWRALPLAISASGVRTG